MKIKKTKDVKTPTRGTDLSAGIDLYIPNDFESVTLKTNESVNIPSGILVEVPKNHMLCAFNKSGIATKKTLQVGACVVDEDYQGEIHIHVFNWGIEDQTLSPGDKIVQFVLVPVLYESIEEVDSIHEVETSRGIGGFGSTNKNDK